VGPHEELLARCDLYRRLCSGAVEGLESEAASNMAPPARVRLSTIP